MTATTIKYGRLDKGRRQSQRHDALWHWQHVCRDGQQRGWQLMAAGTVGAAGGGCRRWRTTTTLAGDDSGRKWRCDDDDAHQRWHGGVVAFWCGGGWGRHREEGGRGGDGVYLFINLRGKGGWAKPTKCFLPILLVETYVRNHTKGKIEILPLASECRRSLKYFFPHNPHQRVFGFNSIESPPPLAASYLLRGAEYKEARIHPL